MPRVAVALERGADASDGRDVAHGGVELDEPRCDLPSERGTVTPVVV